MKQKTIPLVRYVLALGLAAFGVTLMLPGAAEASADDARALSCIAPDECCKICSTGKACGNSCISENKNCHKGRGCACDVEEICE